MRKAIILTIVLLSSTLAFTQVAINKDGSDPLPNSILHVKGAGVNAFFINYATGYLGVNNIYPNYRFHLLETVTDTKNYGTVFEITGGTNNTEKYAGVYSYINGTGGVNRAYEGLSYGANPNSYNIGLSGFGKNAKFNYGIQGVANEANTIALGQNIGGVTEGGNSDYLNIGLWSVGNGSGNWNIGVYAAASQTNAGINYGIFSTSSNTGPGAGDYWSGYFDGKINVDGSIYQNGSVLHAKSVSTIDNASEKVMDLKPVSYINSSDALEFGFDVETMKLSIPELVIEVTAPINPKDEKAEVETNSSVNISAVISILTKAMQEMNEKIDNLENENNNLKEELEQLKSAK
jgi:hypothetical protein